MFGKKKKESAEKQKPSFRDTCKAFVCTMNGREELQVENYGSLGDYNEDKIVLHIEYFTDIDMKVTGRIQSVHF